MFGYLKAQLSFFRDVMRFPVSQITLEAGDVSDRLPLLCSLKMPSGRTASELDHSIIHTYRNSTQKHYWVTSVSWLCRTQSSTSPKSISQDPLWCSECCSWRCYLWVSSVQSNITLIGQQWLEQRERKRTTMSSYSHGNTADSGTAYIIRGAPPSFYTCGWVLFVCIICQVKWTEYWLINRLIDLLSCVSRQFSVVFLY